jgi:hypothetical protein
MDPIDDSGVAIVARLDALIDRLDRLVELEEARVTAEQRLVQLTESLRDATTSDVAQWFRKPDRSLWVVHEDGTERPMTPAEEASLGMSAKKRR